MILTAEHRSSRRKPCPNDILCTSNTTRCYQHSLSLQRKRTGPEDSISCSQKLDTNKQPNSGPAAAHSTPSKAIYLLSPFPQHPRIQSDPNLQIFQPQPYGFHTPPTRPAIHTHNVIPNFIHIHKDYCDTWQGKVQLTLCACAIW